MLGLHTLNEWQEKFYFWSLETVKRIFKKPRARNHIIKIAASFIFLINFKYK